MNDPIDRRWFLAFTAAGVVASAGFGVRAANALPHRVLGKTRRRVSVLGFGGGSRFMMYRDEDEALEILQRCLDLGINYFDTAHSYGGGRSEERFGQVLSGRRRDVFLATKVNQRGYDDALRAFDESLRRLRTDRVDLLHIHGLEGMEDLASIERPDGVLKALYRIRDEGGASFIGMTSHTDAEALRTAIRRHDLDCVMMALNAATERGRAAGFERTALPAALEKNLGVLAMKVTGQDELLGSGPGKAEMGDLLNYALTLPVAACVVGMPRPEHIEENVRLAIGFAPLDDRGRRRVRSRVEG